MFIGDLDEAEIQAIDDPEAKIQAMVWRSWILHSEREVFSAEFIPMEKNGPSDLSTILTNALYHDFIDHVWTSNKVYLEASTIVSTNIKTLFLIYPEKVFKNTIFWMYNFVCYSLYTLRLWKRGVSFDKMAF